MRTIKFRYWCTIEKKMYDKAYVEEHLNFAMMSELLEAAQQRYIFQQFTGLHDKNGREIYEGDIVDGSYLNPMNGKNVMQRYFIEWENGNYRMTFIGSEKGYDRFLWMMHSRIEVVGNIYENPELLK